MISAPVMSDVDASWKEEIEEDYAKRGGKKKRGRK
jgi:hypothetical protein